MRRFVVAQRADDVLLGERRDESGSIGRAHADERPAAGRIGRRHDVAPSSSRPAISRVFSPATCASIAGTPVSCDEPEPGDPGVDVRHRRRARVEAAGRRVRRVVGDVHLEDVLVGEPAGLRRRQPREHLAPHPEEAEAGRGEQVLDRPARDEVGTERAHVDLDRARRLVAVGEHERAIRVGGLGDRRRRRGGDRCGTRSSCSRRGPCARRSPRRSARPGSSRLRRDARAPPPRRGAPAHGRSARRSGTRTR